ncbi:hypothetical protein BDV27DRAFT_102449 [Aspergillus caelatus]|uniref:Secreted protein n=1 Tax=Aspergillus caelatus TaxID=61420 RepID=A0A5N7A6M7_9EURO|nr:uncharacterized protein BDV27DRAFT_102449 [Aspergillus caelatus]KAE8365504.1 hypothetical protein BDV27DRAFT_102449 [Aspergillus caelatus]
MIWLFNTIACQSIANMRLMVLTLSINMCSSVSAPCGRHQAIGVVICVILVVRHHKRLNPWSEDNQHRAHRGQTVQIAPDALGCSSTPSTNPYVWSPPSS